MPTPTPPASDATVSAAFDRLARSRQRWGQALDGARAQRAAQPTGLLAQLTAWRAQPVVALATGLWAAWSRRRANAEPRRAQPAPVPAIVQGRVLSRAGSVVLGAVRRHPVLALSGLALVLGWAGWRRYSTTHRPSGPH